MLRNLAAALALILVSQATFALGLGTLKQSSGLNEPFNGRIGILGAGASDVDTILVRLADSAQFERAGVSRDAVLLQLKFKIVEGGSSADYIQISSREPIREPFLNFLLELNWANGRIIREYTVLLDPPFYDPVRRQAAPSASAPQPVAPPPTQTAEPMVEATPMPAPMSTPTSAQSVPLPSYVADSTLDAVVLNDTLWSIASANLPDESVSIQQMMLALLRANPDAFGSNNINILKRGAILRLPDDAELNAMSAAQAVAEVKRQHQLWSSYRDVATDDIADVPLDSQVDADDDALLPLDAETMADVEPEVDLELTALEERDARLELVAPQAEDDQIGAGGSADGTADVTLAREELDAQVQQNAELQARILEANEIIDLMSRQVDIKDDELAALQARLIELGIEGPITEGEAIVAGQEELPADEVITDGEVIDEIESATEDDEMLFDSTDMDEVDITLGDDEAIADVEEPGSEGIEEELVATVDEEMMVEEGGDAAQEQSGSLLSDLIPAHIASLVPGGAMTIFALLGAGLLGIVALLFKLVGRTRDSDEQELVAAAADEDATALTEGPDDESITESPEDGDADISSEDATEIAPENLETSPDYESTLEASVEELAGELEVDDPLEEVNVYLAYERFDQAEELVREVIAEHPDQHSYKLRLLEVFYSSNNKSAYEVAARDLRSSVQEDDPLWDSAVAMWVKMSPDRDLFAEGAAEEKAEDGVPDDANAFVDITADDEAGGRTMSMAPGSDAVLESTQVGFGATGDLDDDTGSLDFDIGAGDPDGAEDIVDIKATAGTPTDEGEILDLTASMEESDDILESAIEVDDLPIGEADVFDITPTGELAVDNDPLDITTPGPDELLDLLDVTKTGASGIEQTEDILNVTSPGLSDEAVTDESSIDIDISETTPLSDTQEAAAEDVVFDITSPEDDGDESNLDFDIGELEVGEPEVDELKTEEIDETLDIDGGLLFEDGSAGEGLGIDIPEALDISSPDDIDTVEMVPVVPESVDPENATSDSESTDEGDMDFDLSLQSPEFDDLTLGNTLGGALQGSDAASEIEFDLALEDTTEIDRLVIEDTLELPQSSAPDESLEDLTKSMEDSMAGLDLSDDEQDDAGGELDLSLIDTNSGLDLDFGEIAGGDTETSLDFALEGIDLEGMEQVDTLALDTSESDTPVADAETLMSDDDVEQLSDSDEVDTKLNLAKAYIELGEKDGARSIIDEVARDGTPDQKAEAQRLIDQLS